MDAVLGIRVTEHARQTPNISLKRHFAVGPPHDVLRLLAEASFLWAAGDFIPHGYTAPGPARPLQSQRHSGQLPPIDEQADGRTGLGNAAGVLQPCRRPEHPTQLIHLVRIEVGQRLFFAHAAVLFAGAAVLGGLAAAAAGIGRVGNDGIEAVRFKLTEDLQRIPVQNRPAVTKGVSSLALFLDLFAIAYSGKTEYLEELKKAVHLNEEMIGKATSFIQLHYKEFSSMSWVYSCGAGANYGTALESALKMGETIHIPSCCYEIEEYIHGPNLQLTPQYNVIFFDGNDVASHRVEQVYKATRKVSERAYLISNNPGLADDDHVLSLSGTVSSELSPIVYLPFVQLLSFIISNDLHSIYQHPLLKEFKAIAAAKTENFVNYDGDD